MNQVLEEVLPENCCPKREFAVCSSLKFQVEWGLTNYNYQFSVLLGSQASELDVGIVEIKCSCSRAGFEGLQGCQVLGE